ncbi:MAG: F0F1 ATP synthase subunit epsilon [Alphaproteobacteria bacterium]|jgi:F-type H+-transporting ATPase subunit epsilon
MAEQQTIFVKILLPQKPFLVKEVLSVEIPAYEGPYLVLPRRAPSLMLLRCGVVTLRETETSKPEKYFITTGFTKIRDNGCTILTRKAVNVEEVDPAEMKKKLAEYEELEKSDDAQNHFAALNEEKTAFFRMVVGYCEKRNLS